MVHRQDIGVADLSDMENFEQFTRVRSTSQPPRSGTAKLPQSSVNIGLRQGGHYHRGRRVAGAIRPSDIIEQRLRKAVRGPLRKWRQPTSRERRLGKRAVSGQLITLP